MINQALDYQENYLCNINAEQGCHYADQRAVTVHTQKFFGEILGAVVEIYCI